MILDNEDYPEIGQLKDGMILVCHGDDQPDHFADWLQLLAEDFVKLSNLAVEYDVDLCLQDGTQVIGGVMGFCEHLGVKFNSSPWEGSLVSGIYRFGWLNVGSEQFASAQGKMLLKALRKFIDGAVRSNVMRELQDIKDLRIFLDRTADDRNNLRQQIESLSLTLHKTKVDLSMANHIASKAAVSDTSEIDMACIRLATALLSGVITRVVAGPILLWDDGTVYALVNWGGSPIPKNSSPAVLYEGVRQSGFRVVLVSEATMIGGWLSGPIYRKGSNNICDWSRVWGLREKRERSFVVDPPEYTEQVRSIHEAIATDLETRERKH